MLRGWRNTPRWGNANLYTLVHRLALVRRGGSTPFHALVSIRPQGAVLHSQGAVALAVNDASRSKSLAAAGAEAILHAR